MRRASLFFPKQNKTKMLSSSFLPRLRLVASPLKPKILTASNGFSYPSSSSSRALLCSASLEPPDVAKLANAARISLSPEEIEEFGPKIRQVVDWFGQLQAVDLESVEPSLRASTEVGSSSREDAPEIFDNREAIIEAIPFFDDPHIKVPKVVNKE